MPYLRLAMYSLYYTYCSSAHALYETDRHVSRFGCHVSHSPRAMEPRKRYRVARRVSPASLRRFQSPGYMSLSAAIFILLNIRNRLRASIEQSYFFNMLFLFHLFVLSPFALLRAYPLSEQDPSTPNYSFFPVAPLTEGNGVGGDRTPQKYPNFVASANMGYLNENTPSGADAPYNAISFYGADNDSIAPSKPAQSHDGYCPNSLPNKLCCDDDVGTGQHQQDLRANCEICMPPPAFYAFRHR